MKVIDENVARSNLRSTGFEKKKKTKKRKDPPSYMKSTESSIAKMGASSSEKKESKKSFERNVRRRKTLTRSQTPKFTYRTRSQTKKIESTEERALRLAREDREKMKNERKKARFRRSIGL